MTEWEMFRGLVRVLGVVLVGFGLADAFGSLFTFVGFQIGHTYSSTDRAAAALAYLLAGFLITVAAGALTRLIYNPPRTPV